MTYHQYPPEACIRGPIAVGRSAACTDITLASSNGVPFDILGISRKCTRRVFAAIFFASRCVHASVVCFLDGRCFVAVQKAVQGGDDRRKGNPHEVNRPQDQKIIRDCWKEAILTNIYPVHRMIWAQPTTTAPFHIFVPVISWPRFSTRLTSYLHHPDLLI